MPVYVAAWRSYSSAREEDQEVREFIYGLVIGAFVMWGYDYFDAPGVWAYLNGATTSASKSVSGYK